MREIAKAVEQSMRFARHVIGDRRRWPHLEHVERFHHLVVVYDRQYLANSAMRHVVEANQPADPDLWHVISIDEFEQLFDVLRRQSLSQLLGAKAADMFDYQMDFHEYVGLGEGWDQQWHNPLLHGIWTEYFDVKTLASGEDHA
jgi:hypothetical protein